MERAIDGGTLRDNLTDIYGDGNRLVYLKDVLDLIDEQPTITPPNEPLTCEGCMYIDEYFGPCAHCMRARGYVDRYRRLPEGEAK